MRGNILWHLILKLNEKYNFEWRIKHSSNFNVCHCEKRWIWNKTDKNKSKTCEPSNTKDAYMKHCDAEDSLNKIKLQKYKSTEQDR